MCWLCMLVVCVQMPTQGAVTNLIAAPQGVLRNFYPLSGYCQDKCNDININLFTSEHSPEWLVCIVCCHGMHDGLNVEGLA